MMDFAHITLGTTRSTTFWSHGSAQWATGEVRLYMG